MTHGDDFDTAVVGTLHIATDMNENSGGLEGFFDKLKGVAIAGLKCGFKLLAPVV